MDCLFCKIIKKEIPSKSVYEDKNIFAFYDIHPQAEKHILVVPKNHIEDFLSTPDNSLVLEHVLAAVKKIAEIEDLKGSGFRLITNNGKDALQSVKHLHFHILGGNRLSEKMG